MTHINPGLYGHDSPAVQRELADRNAAQEALNARALSAQAAAVRECLDEFTNDAARAWFENEVGLHTADIDVLAPLCDMAVECIQNPEAATVDQLARIGRAFLPLIENAARRAGEHAWETAK